MSRKRKRSRGTDGTVSRRAVLSVGLLASLGTVGAHASGAFDSISSNRNLDFGVADDDDALLGFEPYNVEGEDGERVTIAAVSNQFSSAVELTSIEGIGGSAVLRNIDTPVVPVGERVELAADLQCEDDFDDDVELEIRASGASNSVQLERAVPVTCTGEAERCVVRRDGLKLAGEVEPCAVEIRKWSGGDIEVKMEDDGRPAVLEDSLDIEATGNEVGIEIELEDSSIEGDLQARAFTNESDIEINLEGSTIDGDLMVHANGSAVGIELKLEESTIGGDVTIRSSGGEVEIELELEESTIGGDLEIRASAGELDVDEAINSEDVHGVITRSY
ncbi:hypothetical protein HALLA_13465 [Halostagnicola larsenii XH-48]|uniref:Adhesin domain-containing protein n=1 Tax=Halostagnicola larsenii XH-48 TaxID=797299 RepID=W0JUT5_9EURY|nr:hypothetical protein [Halostagnicola larsenii]AHG01030.1 hypothetical protein HALLA_13465 [Halostagnicola larsenii XH-48]